MRFVDPRRIHQAEGLEAVLQGESAGLLLDEESIELFLARIIHERRSEEPPGRLWQGFAAISNGACLNTT